MNRKYTYVVSKIGSKTNLIAKRVYTRIAQFIMEILFSVDYRFAYQHA